MTNTPFSESWADLIKDIPGVDVDTKTISDKTEEYRVDLDIFGETEQTETPDVFAGISETVTMTDDMDTQPPTMEDVSSLFGEVNNDFNDIITGSLFDDIEETKVEDKVEETKVEDKVEETKVEETKVEETKVEETKVEEAKVEEAKVEETKVDEAKVEEAKVEEAKVEETKVDEAKVEEAKVEEAKVEELKSEETKVEEPNVEELKSEETKVEEPNVEETKVEEKPKRKRRTKNKEETNVVETKVETEVFDNDAIIDEETRNEIRVVINNIVRAEIRRAIKVAIADIQKEFE